MKTAPWWPSWDQLKQLSHMYRLLAARFGLHLSRVGHLFPQVQDFGAHVIVLCHQKEMCRQNQRILWPNMKFLGYEIFCSGIISTGALQYTLHESCNAQKCLRQFQDGWMHKQMFRGHPEEQAAYQLTCSYQAIEHMPCISWTLHDFWIIFFKIFAGICPKAMLTLTKLYPPLKAESVNVSPSRIEAICTSKPLQEPLPQAVLAGKAAGKDLSGTRTMASNAADRLPQKVSTCTLSRHPATNSCV